MDGYPWQMGRAAGCLEIAERDLRRCRRGRATWDRIRTLTAEVEVMAAHAMAARSVNVACSSGGRLRAPVLSTDGFDLFRDAYARALALDEGERAGWSGSREASAAGMIRAARGVLAHARAAVAAADRGASRPVRDSDGAALDCALIRFSRMAFLLV